MVPLSARLRLIAVLFCSSLTALCSLYDRLCFGFVISISARLNLIFSKWRSRAIEGCTGGIQFDLTWKGCGSLSFPWNIYLSLIRLANCSKSLHTMTLVVKHLLQQMPHQLGLEQFSFKLKTMDSAVQSATSQDPSVMLKRTIQSSIKKLLPQSGHVNALKNMCSDSSFSLETDHKPLVPLLTTTALSNMPPRILNFRLRYNPYVLHVPEKRQISANALSRAPSCTPEASSDIQFTKEVETFASCVTDSLPATAQRYQEIRNAQ